MEKYSSAVKSRRKTAINKRRNVIIESAFFSFLNINFLFSAYYKPDASKEYTEDDVVTPYDFLSELTKDWELAAKLPSTVPTRSVVVRTGSEILN